MAAFAKARLPTKSRRVLRVIDPVTPQGFPGLILIRFAILRFSVAGSKSSNHTGSSAIHPPARG